MDSKVATHTGLVISATLAMLLSVADGRAQPQQRGLVVVVEEDGPGPALPIIDVSIDGERRRAEIAPDGQARAFFARTPVGRVVVGVIFRRGGSAQAVATGQEELSLNGSGVVRIRRQQGGAIVIDQYASITLDAKPTKLKLKHNGGHLGETIWYEGFAPDQTHVFIWVGTNNKPVCVIRRKFPPGTVRRYTCVVQPSKSPIVLVQ